MHQNMKASIRWIETDYNALSFIKSVIRTIVFYLDSQSKKTPTLLGDRTYSDNNMVADGESFNASNGGPNVSGNEQLRLTQKQKNGAVMKTGQSTEKKSPTKE